MFKWDGLLLCSALWYCMLGSCMTFNITNSIYIFCCYVWQCTPFFSPAFQSTLLFLLVRLSLAWLLQHGRRGTVQYFCVYFTLYLSVKCSFQSSRCVIDTENSCVFHCTAHLNAVFLPCSSYISYFFQSSFVSPFLLPAALIRRSSSLILLFSQQPY